MFYSIQLQYEYCFCFEFHKFRPVSIWYQLDGNKTLILPLKNVMLSFWAIKKIKVESRR